MSVWLYAENESPPGTWEILFDDVALELAPEPGAVGAALACVSVLAVLRRRR